LCDKASTDIKLHLFGVYFEIGPLNLNLRDDPGLIDPKGLVVIVDCCVLQLNLEVEVNVTNFDIQSCLNGDKPECVLEILRADEKVQVLHGHHE
jgi:hypothetical protein